MRRLDPDFSERKRLKKKYRLQIYEFVFFFIDNFETLLSPEEEPAATADISSATIEIDQNQSSVIVNGNSKLARSFRQPDSGLIDGPLLLFQVGMHRTDVYAAAAQ